MSRVLTATKLVESVRKRAMIPTDTNVYTDESILEIINEEIDAGLLSTLLTLHEEYLVHYEDFQTVNGQTAYPIPYRSVGNKLRGAALVCSSGSIYELSRISIDQLSDYRNDTRSFNRNVFYVENNYIKFADTQSLNSEYIRMYYYLRPNKIVLEKYSGKITDINRTTGVITLSSFPSAFSNLPQMDFVAYRTPNKLHSFDIQPLASDVNTKTMTFSVSDIPSELIVGDYLCNQEETPVPNIPTEMHPLLAQRAAVHILEALGDTEGLANAKAKLQQMELSINNIIDNRVESSPQKVTPRHSALMESRRRRGGY